jgi:hypothetical protein
MEIRLHNVAWFVKYINPFGHGSVRGLDQLVDHVAAVAVEKAA